MLIKINDDDIYIDVTHLRSIHEGTTPSPQVIAGRIRDKLMQTVDNEINVVIIDSGRMEISGSSFHKGIDLCRKLCKKDSFSTTKLPNLSCVIIRTSFYDFVNKQPFYWRFLRTSVKKVPREVKRRVNEILTNQTAIEHQRIIEMILG